MSTLLKSACKNQVLIAYYFVSSVIVRRRRRPSVRANGKTTKSVRKKLEIVLPLSRWLERASKQ